MSIAPTDPITDNQRPRAQSLTFRIGLDLRGGRRQALCYVRPDPVLIAYSVKRSAKGRAVWTRIGAAYPHETGAGLTVLLSAMPLDGRIILLELGADDDARLEREARSRSNCKPFG